jgi:hypothetical protein
MIESYYLVFYILEMIVKMIAHGLFKGKKAYFKVGWNLIDFAIIVLFLIDYDYENFKRRGVSYLLLNNF